MTIFILFLWVLKAVIDGKMCQLSQINKNLIYLLTDWTSLIPKALNTKILTHLLVSYVSITTTIHNFKSVNIKHIWYLILMFKHSIHTQYNKNDLAC